MPRDEESKLVARARRGNADAFRQIVDAYKDRIFAFVWRMVRNHHEAEDITQAAFVRAYEALGSYSEKWALSTWLFTITYRLCVNHLRKRRATVADFDLAELGTTEEESPEAIVSTEEARRLREHIWDAVGDLTAPQKSAVLLFYREGKSCDEIGRVLGIPTVTVKSHLHRARAKLRAALAEHYVEDWTHLRLTGESRSA
ncbi:MAG: sigma-70 family RNA polymerase sigma factor [Phycisphaerales bacterium]|nr:sigma-70 family RNA polymerase sigma factor [Phycisphaerales bacterium]